MTRRVILFVVGSAVAVLVAHMLDRMALVHLSMEKVRTDDWWRLVRLGGFVGFWLVLAVVFVVLDRGMSPARDVWRRGVMVLLGAGTGGLVAEGVKLLVKRLRPEAATEGSLYVFRGWDEMVWSTSGLGLASSHAAVAFGGFWMLGRLHPKGRLVFALLATGTALGRVVEGAHYLSDVVAGAVLGVGCAWAWWEVHLAMERKKRGMEAVG